MSLKYQPEIDGLRALAVIPVILFHMGVSGIPGGFIGVDVFFVISGFLITSIILKEVTSNTFTLGDFWQRRIRRIVPALIPVFLAVSVFSFFFIYNPDANEHGRHGLATSFSVANGYFWLLGMNYWAPQAEDSPFLHTWSLSVEEQFYFLYPILLFWLLRRRRQWALITSFGVLLFSYGLWIIGSYHQPTAAFFLLPFRAWELAAGATLAIFLQPNGASAAKRGLRRQVTPLLGLLMILGPYRLFSEQLGLSWAMIIPVAGTAIVIATAQKGTFIHQLLAHRTLTSIGKLSYSLYLWHWPVLVLTQYAFGDVPRLLQFSIILCAATTSYFLIERPARQSSWRLRSIGYAYGTALMTLAFLAWFEKRHDTSMYDQVVWEGQRFDVSPSIETKTGPMRRRMRGIEMPPRNLGLETAYANDGIINQYGGKTPSIIVAGDSHGLMWSGVLDDIAAELGETICHFSMSGVLPFIEEQVSRSQLGPLPPDLKHAYDIARKQAIERWKPVVVLTTRWSELQPIDRKAAEAHLQWLGNLDIPTLVIGQPPELCIGDKNTPEFLAYFGLEPRPGSSRTIEIGNANNYWDSVGWLEGLISTNTHCSLVSVRDLYLHNRERVRVLEGTQVIYIDDDHLSQAGAERASARLKEGLIRLLGARPQP